MTLTTTTILTATHLAATGTNPLSRWGRASDGLSHSAGSGWATLLVALVGLLLLAVAAWAAMLMVERNRRRAVERFHARADKLGLDSRERNLAYTVALRSGAKDPAAVLVTEPLFDRGVKAGGSSRRTSLFATGKAPGLCGGCPLVDALREKLGFAGRKYESQPHPVEVGNLSEGTTVSILSEGADGPAEAVVARRDERGNISISLGEGDGAPHAGACVVRFSQENMFWEFPARLTLAGAGAATLRPTGPARLINRRRFARSATSRPAHVARFPLRREGASGAPQFVRGELVEVAGPGLKLRAPIDVRNGEKVIVITEVRPQQIIEAIGVSRRIDSRNDDTVTFAVELVGLTTQEVSELAGQTIATAAAGRMNPAPAAAGEGA
jgi:hypothetical protein